MNEKNKFIICFYLSRSASVMHSIIGGIFKSVLNVLPFILGSSNLVEISIVDNTEKLR